MGFVLHTKFITCFVIDLLVIYSSFSYDLKLVNNLNSTLTFISGTFRCYFEIPTLNIKPQYCSRGMTYNFQLSVSIQKGTTIPKVFH